MLSLIVSSASYAPALRSAAPVVQRAAAPTMKKSEALPFMEEPAHLAGMVGNVGFDPLSLSVRARPPPPPLALPSPAHNPRAAPPQTPQNIKWMREAELKHGRMTMLAWTGYVAVDLGLKLPGAKYAALTSYTAHQGTADYELFFLLLLVGTAETIGFKQIYDMMDGADRDAGDFGFDPLMLLKGNEVQYKEAELVHGRAAMLAFSAVVTQGAMNDAFGVGSQTFPYF